MSKGDNRRPAAVKREEFERRWVETFGARVVVEDAYGVPEAPTTVFATLKLTGRAAEVARAFPGAFDRMQSL